MENNMIVGVDTANGDDQTILVDSVNNKEVDLGRAKELFGMRDQLQTLESVRGQLDEQAEKVVGSSVDIIIQRIENLSVEQLKVLDEQQVRAIYEMEDGVLELDLSHLDTDKSTEMPSIVEDGKDPQFEFKRDFLIFLKETEEVKAKMNKDIEELNTLIEDSQEEFNTLVKEFGNFDELVQAELQQRLQNATTSDEQAQIQQMIDAYAYAISLENVYQHYKHLGTENTIYDYKRRSEVIYKKYVKVAHKMNLTADITRFANVETRLLPEKYHIYPNLFVFVVMKYIGYKTTPTKTIDGVFLSSLMVNLRDALSTDETKQEKRDKLAESISRVLDLFIGDAPEDNVSE